MPILSIEGAGCVIPLNRGCTKDALAELADAWPRSASG